MPDQLDRLKTALADRYRVERQLGTGGMAIVYLAEDLHHHRQVAVKVLRPELAAALGASRFLREIEISAHLTHPHLLPLYDSGETDGFLYSVMPYISGGSLRERLRQERQLPINEAVALARDVADGLAYAHGHGIVHRDIKPENILFEGNHAIVADFGLAQAVLDAGGERLTATGIAVGTPIYMSPEQATAQGAVGAQSDIYSLGCVLYEMLAGDPPFTGANSQAVLMRKVVEGAPSLRAVRETVSEDLEEVILKALAKSPADRYANASAFSEALEGARTSAVRPRSRKRWLGGVQMRALGGTIAASALLAAGWWFSHRAETRIDSLVVLPLHDVSSGETQAHLVDAMHGAIIAELGQIGSLRTISQWSALRYRDAAKSVPEIARELDVEALVEASVSISADSVRIQVQVIQAHPEERQLWSHSFASDIRSVQALQSEVARGIANQLGAVVTPAERARLARSRPVVPEAYDEYAKARFAWNKYTAASIQEAIGHFQQAVSKDPDYALAYVGLADAYGVLPYYAAVDPRSAFPKAKAAAKKALELDPTLGEAYMALAWPTAAYDWDWKRAEQFYRRAVELSPSYARGHQGYAQFLGAMGRFDEAIAEMTRARELDPLSPRIMAHLGLMYAWAHQDDHAISIYQETLARYPGFARARWDLGRTYLDKREYQKAIAEFETAIKLQGGAGGSATSKAELARAFVGAGRRAEATRILGEMKAERERSYVGPLNIAMVHTALGQKEQAFEWLQRAYEEHDGNMVLLKVLSHFDPLREDPRFQDLLGRMRFPS